MRHHAVWSQQSSKLKRLPQPTQFASQFSICLVEWNCALYMASRIENANLTRAKARAAGRVKNKINETFDFWFCSPAHCFDRRSAQYFGSVPKVVHRAKGFSISRGYYRSGYQNGSESTTESVRNAFLGEVSLLTSAFSRKVHGAAGRQLD